MKTVMLFAALMGFGVEAMPIQTKLIKPRASYQEVEGHLLEALDLKSKTMFFGKAEFDQCGTSLARDGQTLTYRCVIPIPSQAKISKFRRMLKSGSMEIPFGRTKRTVLISIDDQARQLKLSTAFDATGIDFEVFKFNDDFFAVYAKVAHTILIEALKKAPISIEVLENT